MVSVMLRSFAATLDLFQNGGLVKICGLREPVHTRAAVTAGADLLGFIFAPARRRVTADITCACIEAARQEGGDRRVLAVGVFVDASADEMNRAADAAGLDLLQLHGDEEPAQLGLLNRPVIKGIRVAPGTPPHAVKALVARYRDAANAPVAFLVDGYAAEAHGGTGVKGGWDLAAALAHEHPVVVAGGLDPDNVADAINRIAPIAVDVSSGVETGGVKDPAKIAAFVAVAKRAFGAI